MSISRRRFLAAPIAGIIVSAARRRKVLEASELGIPWAVPSLPYRVLAEVAAVDLGARKTDRLPASLKLDVRAQAFDSLHLNHDINLDSIQVLRYDPQTGQVMAAPTWPFARTEGERASRFLDLSLPWDFPMVEEPGAPPARTFARGGLLMNVRGTGNPGLLVWDHTQDGSLSSHYAIYFEEQKPGSPWKAPRQGFLGDGSPRHDERAPALAGLGVWQEASSLTGTWYNRVDTDDWDGDGLVDLIVGVGSGNVLLFLNRGDKRRAKFTDGEYLRTADGNILDAGSMSCPKIVDWNGDGVKDLLVGVEGARLVWYENVGSNQNRKFAYRGFIQADGKDLIIPAAPCPESPHYTRDYAPTVEVVDWNGDGGHDLLLGGYITGYIWLYEDIGKDRNHSPELSFRGPVEADGKPIDTIWGAAPCAVDLNGDGRFDLITGSFGQRMGGGDAVSKFFIYYENIGTRSAPRFTQRSVEYEGEEPKDILATPRPFQRNERGALDLAVSTMGEVYMAHNVGTEHSPRWKVEKYPSHWGLAPLSFSQLIDLNSDGHPDLVRSPLDGSDVPQVFINKGLGTQGVFAPPKPLLPPGQEISHPMPYGDPWTYVYLYDFDGDGTLDLLWADGPGYAYLHRNKGTNQNPQYDTAGERLMLTNGQPIKVGPPVVPIDQIKDFTMMQGSRAGIVAADFDGDGKTDLAMGDTYGDLYYFRNAGTNQKPVFEPGVELGNLDERALPLVHDWDHDGRVDIVGVAWSGKMAWYRNQGPGAHPQFAPGQKIELPPTVPYSPRLVIGDWDEDGHDDFLVMSSYPWFCWLDGSYIKHGYCQARLKGAEVRRKS
jgi:FG-GAP-like repeat